MSSSFVNEVTVLFLFVTMTIPSMATTVPTNPLLFSLSLSEREEFPISLVLFNTDSIPALEPVNCGSIFIFG